MTGSPNAASVALIHNHRVLLIQRAYAPYQHLWTLPGGRIEPGETIVQCATREIKEELGLTVIDLRPVLQQSLGTDGQFRLAVFATQTFDGGIISLNEIAAYRWVDPTELGAFKTTVGLDDVLDRAFALFRET